MEQQVTDKLETKLQELPYFYNVQSYTKPGETVIYVSLRDDVPPAKVPDLWYQVRKKIGDIRGTLPQGVVGPVLQRRVRRHLQPDLGVRGRRLLRRRAEGDRQGRRASACCACPTSPRPTCSACRTRRSTSSSATPGSPCWACPVDQILDVVRRQNAIVAAGTVETKGERMAIRVDGAPTSAEELMALPFSATGRTLTLGDVAEIKRGYTDPPQISMRFNGQAGDRARRRHAAPAATCRTLGKALDKAMAEIERDLPVGITVHRVADQPEVVEQVGATSSSSRWPRRSAIVLVVSFISLGLRTGIIVALSVPLVLAITFVVMMLLGHRLPAHLARRADHRARPAGRRRHHRRRDDDGEARAGLRAGCEAATFAYTSTAFPMLTGTLVTAAGFVPVGFAKSSAGEYTNSIFWVVGLSLVISWFVAVLFTPWIGYHLLPTPKVAPSRPATAGRLYTAFRKLVDVVRRPGAGRPSPSPRWPSSPPWAPSAWCRSSSSRPPTGPS